MKKALATILRNPLSLLRAGNTPSEMNFRHLERLLSDFALGSLISCSSDQEGLLNRCFFIKASSGKYFVKNYLHANESKINYIASVEKFMFHHGIPAICMVPSITDRNFVKYEKSFYSIYPFVERDRSELYVNADYIKMGRLLAKIHRVGAGNIPDNLIRRELLLERKAGDFFKKFESYRSFFHSKKKLEDIELKILQYINLKVGLLSYVVKPISIPCTTLVHGDFHPHNLFLNPTTREIIGICDWEKTGMAPRSYELAQSIFYVVFNGKCEKGKSIRSAKSYTEGYLSIFPISRDEFEKGMRVRMQHLVLTTWVEDLLFRKKDKRASEYVDTEMKRLTWLFKENLAEEICLLFK